MPAAEKAARPLFLENRGKAKQEAPRRKAPALLLVKLANLPGAEPHLQEVLEALAIPAAHQMSAMSAIRLGQMA